MRIGEERRAVFLDRDGVINEDWLNPATGEWESPLAPESLIVIDGAIEGMRALRAAGFRLFLVSNQPSFAKGKATLEALHAVHDRLVSILAENGIHFSEFYYSYSHPDAVVPGYGGECHDRKPSPYFLHKAAREHQLDMANSWMVGDRESDVECGVRAGVRTIRVRNTRAGIRPQTPEPDAHAEGLFEAAQIILRHFEVDRQPARR
jgi:D-glycero-D-manno-heptose 1,7-bisphosphate phosphatase